MSSASLAPLITKSLHTALLLLARGIRRRGASLLRNGYREDRPGIIAPRISSAGDRFTPDIEQQRAEQQKPMPIGIEAVIADRMINGPRKRPDELRAHHHVRPVGGVALIDGELRAGMIT